MILKVFRCLFFIGTKIIKPFSIKRKKKLNHLTKALIKTEKNHIKKSSFFKNIKIKKYWFSRKKRKIQINLQ